jgi:flagellar P-ring protein precursor FlgI
MSRAVVALLFALPFLLWPDVGRATRVKDLGTFYGHRDNPLTGAGLVVGLRRTGDSTRNEAAIRALANRLQGHGVSLQLDEISSRNAALVMVSGALPPGARTGSRIDVTVASTGDAASLEGGVLLLAHLQGTDGQVYAVAEGPLTVGGFVAESDGAGSRKNTPTVGRIAEGGLVEREVPGQPDWTHVEEVDFVLRRSDFTTASRLAAAVDTAFGSAIARAASASTVRLMLPEDLRDSFAEFAAKLEALDVTVDVPARVVVNERTGTVVMGADVRVAPVAVAHGGLTIEVRRENAVSQPAPFSNGTTAAVSNTDVSAQEGRGKLVLVEGAQIGDVVAALNDMGVTPRDLIVILEAIRAAGALDAALEIL